MKKKIERSWIQRVERMKKLGQSTNHQIKSYLKLVGITSISPFTLMITFLSQMAGKLKATVNAKMTTINMTVCRTWHPK